MLGIVIIHNNNNKDDTLHHYYLFHSFDAHCFSLLFGLIREKRVERAWFALQASFLECENAFGSHFYNIIFLRSQDKQNSREQRDTVPLDQIHHQISI